MQGDFTRDTFQKENHIRQTLMQQGRVQLDADWNEQTAITARRDETMMEDVVGDCGGPAERAAFGVLEVKQAAAFKLPDATGGDFYLSAGRYYVDGIQCELREPVLFTKQPDRIGLKPIEGMNLLYLDVWHRHITALDDASLLEAALGGVDTATRVKTIWQVRALRLRTMPGEKCGATIQAYDDLIAPSGIRMSAQTRTMPNSDDPCQVPETSGYKGLENQLYRIEIHDLNDDGTAKTWKWSRENGSVVTAITDLAVEAGNTILTVASTGRDDALGFKDGNIVELRDDRMELENEPGLIALIDGNPVDGKVKLKIFPGRPLPIPADINLDLRPKLRRWEGFQMMGDEAAELEAGIMVAFHERTKRCRGGDYWQIPARTATATSVKGDIEWPRDGNDAAKLLPRGIEHHYCRLGFVVITKQGGQGTEDPVTFSVAPTDCRCLWPALTAPRLAYAGGAGQNSLPALDGRPFVPMPLVVSALNGQCHSGRVSLRFRVTVGKGIIARSQSFDPVNTGTPPGGATDRIAIPAPNDLFAVNWWLENNPALPAQRVEADLFDVDAESVVAGPIYFTANLPVESRNDSAPMHVLDVKTGKPQRLLPNDSDVTIKDLEAGVFVYFDQVVDPSTIVDPERSNDSTIKRGQPTCYLTAEIPYPVTNSERQDMVGFDLSPAQLVGYRPLVLRADVKFRELEVVEPPPGHEIPRSVVALQVDQVARQFLDAILNFMSRLKPAPDRLLLRLTLKGNFIWSEQAQMLFKRRAPGGFLDGDAYRSTPGFNSSELILPSGDNRRGGDFEMWFWLAASVRPVPPVPPRPVGLNKFTLAPQSLRAPGISRCSVELDSPALSGGATIKLLSQHPEVVKIPEAVVVKEGQASTSFDAKVVTPSQTFLRRNPNFSGVVEIQASFDDTKLVAKLKISNFG